MASGNAWGNAWQERRAHQQALSDEEFEQRASRYADELTSNRQILSTIDPQRNASAYAAKVADLQQNLYDLRELYHPDKNPGAISRFGHLLTDRLGLTNPQKRIQLVAKRRANASAGDERAAQELAAATPQPLNKYVQIKREMEAGGFGPEDIQKAMRTSAGLVPRDSTETERFISNFKTEHPGATDEDALKAYTKATAKPTTPKGMKVITLGGIPAYVRDQDAGQDYYPDAKGNFPAGTPTGVTSAFNAEAQSAKAKEARDDQKRQDEEAFQESMAEIRERIHDREQALAESSKIPSTEANRYTQAQILKEQTATLREMLDNPDVSQYMGPVAGHTYGYVASLYSKKIRDLFVAQKSLSALLPILHGYRGGAQTQATFDNMSGNMAIDVNAYQGTLDAIDKLADNIEKEVQADYPNAPMFKGGGQTPAPTPGPANLGGSKGSRSLAAAMTLPVNKGKTETEVEQDLIAHGYTVTRP